MYEGRRSRADDLGTWISELSLRAVQAVVPKRGCFNSTTEEGGGGPVPRI
jgi:hypothetical protein